MVNRINKNHFSLKFSVFFPSVETSLTAKVQLKSSVNVNGQKDLNQLVFFFSFPVFLSFLCLLAVLLPPASSCPPSCLCSSDMVVDCRGRGLTSLPPLHLLPPGSRSFLLTNNRLSSLGASAFANLSSLEVCCPLFCNDAKVSPC